MREIVSIQCGQAGNQVGSAFWETIMQEHGLDAEGRAVAPDAMNDRLDVFFQESSTRKYVPRAIAIDLEPATLDNIRNGPLGGVFRPDNMIGGQSGAGNNWAKGFYTEGAELREPAMDAIRREAEVADSLQGFQVTHSLGGGTGSGMGTLLLTAIREEFNDRMLSTYSILPSPQASETVTEPYNAMMALHHLIDSSNLTHCLDNEALYNICTRTLKINQPTHQDLNKLIAMVMSGTTTGLRYPGQLNGDLRKMAVNLVPFTRMHFFSTAFAPLVAPNTRAFHNLSVPELTQQLFNSSNTMVACDQNAGKYLAVSTTFRGKVATKEVEDCIQAAYDKRRELFVDWIPNNFLTSVCSAPPIGFDTSATLVANTTGTMELLRRTEQQFHQMFERKAFLHWYTSEGMEESEFGEASSNVYDLFSEYEQAHNWTQSDTIEGVDESMIPDEEDVMEE